MKILVTGANGFIGSNLVKLLTNKGYDIFAISRKSTLISNLNIKIQQCDIKDIKCYTDNIIEFNPDVVVHCAWDGGNNYHDIHHRKQFDNVIYSQDLLEIVSQLNNPHFICIGSASEYGHINEIIDENKIELPNTPYSISKFSFKLLSSYYCHKNNIDWSWVRPFYTYGPNDVNTRLIPKTIINCINNVDMELNSCESIIDYLYITDFVKGLEKIIDYRLCGIYNICSGTQLKVKDIIDTIQQLTGSKNKITYNKALNRDNFPTYICGSSTKLQTLIDWKPTTTIIAGLTATIQHFK